MIVAMDAEKKPQEIENNFLTLLQMRPIII